MSHVCSVQPFEAGGHQVSPVTLNTETYKPSPSFLNLLCCSVGLSTPTDSFFMDFALESKQEIRVRVLCSSSEGFGMSLDLGERVDHEDEGML